MTLRRLAVLLLALLPLAARAQFNGPGSLAAGQELNRPATLTTDPALLYPATHDLLLATGDLLSLRIYGQPDFAPSLRINVDGEIKLPFIGKVHLAGLTLTQAETLVAERLIAAGIYVNPQVSITVSEGPNAVITVIGEAHGVVPAVAPRHLEDVLTAVGGLPGTASHVITIHRPGVDQPILVDLGSDPLRSQLANVPVFAGDTIVISRIGIVYMLGSFKTPGTISLNAYGPTTLMQATALSGGPAFEARYDDLRIIRTIGDQRTMVKVDIHKVLFGKAPDPILQPNDIVFLPTSIIKGSINNGSLNTLFSITGLIIALAYR
jgi:polysaccharide export outer membrane protein